MKEYKHYGAVYLQPCECKIICPFYFGVKKKNWRTVCVCTCEHDGNSFSSSLLHSGGVDLLKLPISSKAPMVFFTADYQ